MGAAHGMTAGTPSVTAPARLARLLHPPRWLVIGAGVVVLVVAVRFVVLPQYASAVTELASLEHLSIPLVVVASLLELSSLLVFSLMTRAALGRPRPTFGTLLRIDLTDLGVNHVVPGGGTTSAAVRFALLTRVGVARTTALTAAAVEVTMSNLVLGLLFVVGLLLSITTLGGNAADTTALIATLAFVLLVGALLWALTRHASDTARLVGRLADRVPIVTVRAAEDVVLQVSRRLHELAGQPRRVATLVVLGLLNWLLDAGALAVVLAACGHAVAIGPLLTVYGVGSILAMLPLTPGGLGIVEGVMVPALIATGVPAAPALLGVVGWRLLEYWLPIPLAAGAAVSLRLTWRGTG